jgi:MinD-like ATPase involved in chromosome partitioning or flagellar assembly
MTTTELLIVSAVPGLTAALSGYEGLEIMSAPSLARATDLLGGTRPPQAVYVEDVCGSPAELWEVVRRAQALRLPVLAGLRGVAAAQLDDLVDAGLAVTHHHDAEKLGAWIAEQLGARLRPARQQVSIAVAGAKGGIGKSLVVALLAEGMRRRGLRVLVVDGDLSNSGLVPTFRIPSGFPSYLHIAGDASRGGADQGAWAPQNIRRYVYHHEASGIDFLLGSEETTDARDLQRPEWLALMQGIRGLREYDVVLLDTGPEIKKRPYAILCARDGGWVVLPTPPGRKERAGAGNMLRVLQNAVAGRDLTDRCLLLFMDPERGVTATVDQIAPLFARHFPSARALGRLPRAPRQVSVADEEGDRYVSPLDVAPHSRLSRSAHELVDRLCATVGIQPPRPMPRSSLWQRLRGERAASALHGNRPLQHVETGEVTV